MKTKLAVILSAAWIFLAASPVVPAAEPEIEVHRWSQGQPPLRLIRKEEGFCALTSVSGHFQGGGEQVRVYIGDDGYWYLGGKSQQKGVSAECIVVHLPVTAPAQAEATPAPTAGPAGELKILAASYQYGSQFSDVTARVQELLRGDEVFQANPDFLRTDPHPGGNKGLVIFCEVNGKRAIFSVGEGENVSRELVRKNARLVAEESAMSDGGLTFERDAAIVAARDRFPKIALPTNEDGGPVIQTVHLNDKVVEGNGQRYSGFRFVVDRTEAAAKQNTDDKKTMSFFWFFVSPPARISWYILPVGDEPDGFEGFNNFSPLKRSSFKDTEDYLPAKSHEVIFQHLPSNRLTDGHEYIIWFGLPETCKEPVDMTVSLGYKYDERKYDTWGDMTDIVKFLGLVPKGQKIDGRDESAW